MDELIDAVISKRQAVQYISERYPGAFQVKQTLKDDGVFALRSFTIEDSIPLPFPLIHAIDSESITRSCYACLHTVAVSPVTGPKGSANLKTCNGCRFARFCNRECQIKAWLAYHKYECRIMKPPLPALARAVMRIVLLRDRGILSDDEWLLIQGLNSHVDEYVARGRSNLTELAEAVRVLTASTLSAKDIEKLFFIMRSNAVELPGSVYGSIGIMLDPLIAKINHSCSPNITIYRSQNGNDLDVVPLRDIAGGEELLNCYVSPIAAVDERREKLREQYFFECDCTLCEDDIAALKEVTPDVRRKSERRIKQVQKLVASNVEDAVMVTDGLIRCIRFPLYSSGKLPEALMVLVHRGLKSRRLDAALTNLLRVHFLINHERLIGMHNPTHLYTITLVLDVLDILLKKTNEVIEASLSALQTRGLEVAWLKYWRQRFLLDLRARVKDTVMQNLVDGRDENDSIISEHDLFESDMGRLLNLDTSIWKQRLLI